MRSTVLAICLAMMLALNTSSEDKQFKFGEFFDGLHVTGKPIDIDPATFRLTVTGKVDNPLSLSFDDVKALPTVSKKITLECPGAFTDTGNWTGVPVRELLRLAGIRKDAKTVIFSTPDGSYKTRFTVDVASDENMLIAYQFNGKEFHRVHGFPLRLVAGGHEGSDWVKWLGKIIVE